MRARWIIQLTSALPIAVGSLGLLGSALMTYVLQRWRARARAADAGPEGRSDVPVRLRGVAPDYPPFWRAGRLDPATGDWRPRGGWGLSQTLATVRCYQSRTAKDVHYLPPMPQTTPS